MDLTRYVDELRHELLTAAEAGGEESRQLADRLVPALQSATRLVLLDALSDAAAEITADLAPGSVEVRLRGRDPEFVVSSADIDPSDDALAASPSPIPVPVGAGGQASDRDEVGTSRVTLRLPESLKLRIEEAAAAEGLSVNSWLVRLLAGVVEPSGGGVGPSRRSPVGGERFTGWARS